MATATQSAAPIRAEQQFVLHGVTWEAYETLLEALGERPIRLTYDRGTLELMSPSNTHEWLIRLLDRLINALTEELGIPIRGCRCTTWRRRDVARGLEPDDAYYVQSEPLVRFKATLDLTVDPPPDLALEINVASSSLDRMGIYAALRVPAVWRLEGEHLTVYQLDASGRYQPTDTSAAFPFLRPADLLRFLDLRKKLDETHLIRIFRQWVRETFPAE